jgi:hypothetical protein
MRHKEPIIYLCLLVILLTTGCFSSTLQEENPTDIVDVSPFLDLSKSTSVATSTAIITQTPSLSPITATAEIVPTLLAADAKALVFEYLQNNAFCSLPCLWGMIPGEIDIDTVERFVKQFGNQQTPDIYISTNLYSEFGGTFLAYRENYVHIISHLSYFVNNEIKEIEFLRLHGYAMQEVGKDLDWLSSNISPLYGDASFNKAFSNLLLPKILSDYGKPGKVLVAAFPDELDRPSEKWYPFTLVLFYPDKGIFVEYIFPREQKGNDYIGCPWKAEIIVAVWDPNREISFVEVVKDAGLQINELNIDYFLPVDEATSMTVDDFFQNFQDSTNTECLKTPMELWPPV